MDIDVKETPEYKMILALDRCIDNINEILKILERLGKSYGTA